ncbi:hypothetical protein INT45_007180 [Circinella minor]|uniref:Major facilitator superfamily (MFS) profile domain-containing protein n=1 Tax=Circinella minor TaxID=1195481 RepID=A0A8H7S634_9FUNG|nr:hypothetical protein INT45_007180 [Circinella minor]
MNLFEDTSMNGNEFNWAGSLYYADYLLFLFLNQYFMHRFALSKYLGLMLIFWGVTLGCTVLVRNFQQLAALRFMLGFWESAAMPCVWMIISITYRRREQALLFGLILSTYAFGGVIGGVTGYGFLNLNDVYGLSSWKWYTIVLGVTTVIVGLITFLFMPDNAKSRWYRLTPEEKEIVKERIQDSAVIQESEINFEHILDPLKNYDFIVFS